MDPMGLKGFFKIHGQPDGYLVTFNQPVVGRLFGRSWFWYPVGWLEEQRLSALQQYPYPCCPMIQQLIVNIDDISILASLLWVQQQSTILWRLDTWIYLDIPGYTWIYLDTGNSELLSRNPTISPKVPRTAPATWWGIISTWKFSE